MPAITLIVNGSARITAAVLANAVLANAILDATGVHLRAAPFTAPRVKAAMTETTTKTR